MTIQQTPLSGQAGGSLVSSLQFSTLVDRLRTLGLTTSEAKAYLAVLGLGRSSAAQIARAAELQRTEIYRLMSSLVSLGLVEENLDTPRRYRPLKVKDAILQLVNENTSRLRDIAEKSGQLVSSLEALGSKTERTDEPEVRIINGAHNVRRTYLDLASSAQSEVWMMLRKTQVLRAPSHFVTQVTSTIASKGVKARAILEVDQENFRRVMSAAPVIEVRHIHPLQSNLYGFDDQCVGIELTRSGPGPHQSSMLLISHRPCVQAMRSMFDALWNQATPLSNRVATLQRRPTSEAHTRIIWGREQIYANSGASWKAGLRERVMNMTTRRGPLRILRGAKEHFIEASNRGVKLEVICDVYRGNLPAVKKLCEIAEVRHNRIPTRVSLEILDQSEGMIHYVEPDTAELSSSTDVAIITSDQASIRDLTGMFEIIWENSIPAAKRIKQLSRRPRR